METIHERYRQLRLSLKPKKSQKAFGEPIGLSLDSVANIEYGRVTPSETLIKLTCSVYNVNRSWLEEGVGEMYETPTVSGVSAEVQAILGHDNPFAVAVISALLQMPKPWWEAWEAEYDRVIGRTEEQKEDNG